ncbi:MAG: Ni/Fe-hydrogenase cytochrome b subunit [Thermodesulfovibrionales bacterium]
MSEKHEIKMFTPLTVVFIGLFGLGCWAAFYRLTKGLGAATNLSDRFPWGFWIGFDVLGGVAMAAGGFLIAGCVYLLHWEKYRPIVRPAILNAFFGYLLAALAIMLDIGVPWRIWHPVVPAMWQIHSVMWIVAIHVVLYTTTLATESSPMIFEKLNLQSAAKLVKLVMVPVVLFGVLLSTLHQSSLGAVYLITPAKMSPLWYNSQLPYLFLISAIAMGLSMVSFETILSAKAFRHELNMDILSGLARGCFITLSIYLALKVYLLAQGPGLGAAFSGTTEAKMFLLEMTLGVLIPVALLAVRKVRETTSSILVVNVMVVVGVLINRMNVGIFGLYRDASAKGGSYFPSTIEILLTLGFISFSVLGFKLAAKYLDLFPEEAKA